MDGFDVVVLTVAILFTIACGKVSQHFGMGPIPGLFVAVAAIYVFTRVFRVG